MTALSFARASFFTLKAWKRVARCGFPRGHDYPS